MTLRHRGCSADSITTARTVRARAMRAIVRTARRVCATWPSASMPLRSSRDRASRIQPSRSFISALVGISPGAGKSERRAVDLRDRDDRDRLGSGEGGRSRDRPRSEPTSSVRCEQHRCRRRRLPVPATLLPQDAHWLECWPPASRLGAHPVVEARAESLVLHLAPAVQREPQRQHEQADEEQDAFVRRRPGSRPRSTRRRPRRRATRRRSPRPPVRRSPASAPAVPRRAPSCDTASTRSARARARTGSPRWRRCRCRAGSRPAAAPTSRSG